MMSRIWSGARGYAGLAGGAVALLGWVALIWRWRPREPFTGEEFTALLAIEGGAGPTSPFECLGWVLGFLVGDRHRALQGVAVLASATCLWLIWSFGQRLTGRAAVGWFAAVGLAAMPGFLFYAGVGLADALSLALLVGAWGAGLAALERLHLVWAVAAASVAAVASKPSVWPALAPLVVVVLVVAWRRKGWRALGLAALVVVLAGAAFWAPRLRVRGDVVPVAAHEAVVAGSGPETPSAGPGFALAELGRAWLAHPFGHRRAARLVWVLALTGAVAWWRAGHRRVIGLLGGGALAFLVAAMGSEPLASSVRHGLPVLPFMALAAAGHLLWPSRPVRRSVAVLAVGVAAFMVWESSPAIAMRRRPTPVFAAFEHVASSFDARSTHLVIGRDLAPHAAWWLPRVGRDGEGWKTGHYYFDRAEDGRRVVMVTSEPVPGLRVEFERTWSLVRFGELAGGRYATAVVQIPPRGVGSIAMPGVTPGEDTWTLSGQGWLELPEASRPRACVLCPLSSQVTIELRGQTVRELWPGECADLLLLGGAAGRIGLRSPDAAALVQPLEFSAVAGDWSGETPLGGPGVRRFPAELSWVVPVVARLAGAAGAEWITEMVVANEGGVAGEVVVARLPSKRRGNLLPGLVVPLPAGESVRLDDVLARPELADGTAVGGLLVGLDAFNPDAEAKLEIVVRTFNRRSSGGSLDGSLVPVPLSKGVVPGESVTLGEVVVADGERLAVGATAVGASAVKIEFAARDHRGREVARRGLSVPVLGQAQEPWPVPEGRWQIECVVAPGDRGVRVVPYLSRVDRNGRTRYLVGASTSERAFGSTILVNAAPVLF